MDEKIKIQTLTDIEWYESTNVGLSQEILRPIYKNRPPVAFTVLLNADTRERIIITSHLEKGWDKITTGKIKSGN